VRALVSGPESGVGMVGESESWESREVANVNVVKGYIEVGLETGRCGAR